MKNKINYFRYGKKFVNDPFHIEASKKNILEEKKEPNRTHIINYLLSHFSRETTYLEIGVRNPEDNFNHIISKVKHSVDPGLENKENPVDFTLTSNSFFEKLDKNEILDKDVRFDVIFIDGLHLAEQVDLDIENSIRYLKEDGFIVMHDCNPPTEWHASEEYLYRLSPARGRWNGTTWKAFLKWRFNPEVYSCCIDSDWGIGIISKKYNIGNSITPSNFFYEFNVLNENRNEYLNLINFNKFKEIFSKVKSNSNSNS